VVRARSDPTEADALRLSPEASAALRAFGYLK